MFYINHFFFNLVIQLWIFLQNFFVAICSTLTVATANPLITPIELHKFDYNPSSKPLIFNNEDNLSRLNCGKLENIVTTRGKHFPWDAQVKIGDRTCAAIFISPKAILTSKLCWDALKQTETYLIFCYYFARCNLLWNKQQWQNYCEDWKWSWDWNKHVIGI